MIAKVLSEASTIPARKREKTDMAKEKSIRVSLIDQIFEVGLYKRNQGRIARQVTFAAVATLVALGAWQLSVYWQDQSPAFRYAVPSVLFVVGMWLSYRIVNIASFADFLIAVEGEMAKVSWPNRTELIRSSIVVIVTIILLAAVLFAYDLIWRALLRALGILN